MKKIKLDVPDVWLDFHSGFAVGVANFLQDDIGFSSRNSYGNNSFQMILFYHSVKQNWLLQQDRSLSERIFERVHSRRITSGQRFHSMWSG
ncbi:hypothetical protein NPIL_258631 [Nephila pilipes]|uniref:Uncharacterized protein n=1 Tax=Nephila pilipes TaxID=299642 RepID=A0A8X6NTI6_NEPPI|nr:hypothetical protein NPIL_258631 [Nephila pilipes]